MRFKTWGIAGAAAAALAFAGIAIADETLSQTTTSASLSANTVSDLHSSTCTNANGTFESTHAKYAGTATGAAPLSGPVKMRVESLVNTSTGVGLLKGAFTVDPSGKGKTDGRLSAVVSNGTLAGWIEGHGPSGKFAGTFTGTWNKSTGFGSLSIGTSSTNNLLLLTSGRCPEPHHPKKP